MRVFATRMGPQKCSIHSMWSGSGKVGFLNAKIGTVVSRSFAPDPQSGAEMAHIVHKSYCATMIHVCLYINRPRHPQ